MLTRGLWVLCVLLITTPASAQQAESLPRVAPLLENVTRVESWSFFAPPPGGGDPDYTFLGNRGTLGVFVNASRVSFQGSFRYAQLVGLPRRANGPGPLGPGAMYFAAARTPEAYQLFFKSLSLQVKDVFGGLSVEAGRMSYQSGEGTPFRQRLIGTAGSTIFERAFDGARADLHRNGWKAHASFVMPTQGAFEESANPTMGKVQVASASWSGSGLQVFAHDYRDRRLVRARPDNTGFAAARVDVHLQTYGASAVGTLHNLEVGLWGALQRGRWFDTRHRAFSVMATASHRAAAGRRVISGGLVYASGDGNAGDGVHGTFFPMVPSPAPETLGGTFAQMNVRDLFARIQLRPLDAIGVTGEVHHLSLADAFDRWYSGTGATVLRGEDFGFSSRPSRFARSLATSYLVSLDAVVTPRWTAQASAGFVYAGDVIRRQFAGGWSRVLMFQSRWRL